MSGIQEVGPHGAGELPVEAGRALVKNPLGGLVDDGQG
jgi:hypothetical protein